MGIYKGIAVSITRHIFNPTDPYAQWESESYFYPLNLPTNALLKHNTYRLLIVSFCYISQGRQI